MRLFVATRLDGDFLDELSRISAGLKQKIDGGIKWVEPENFHITYRFLGDVSESARADIIKSMKLIEPSEFCVSAGNLRCFPSFLKPSVIWLGIDEGADKLKEISEKLRLNLPEKGGRGFKNDFLPHITIARVKGIIRSDMREVFQNVDYKFKSVFKVSVVELFESELSSSGPVYRSLYKQGLVK